MTEQQKQELIALYGPEMAEEIENPPTCSTGYGEVRVTLMHARIQDGYLLPDDDGFVHYHCNICGADFTRTQLQLTVGSFSMYAHYKPGREPAQVPDVFKAAFEG